MMKHTLVILTVALLFMGGVAAEAATLLYQDTFDNTSRITPGALGSVATWSSVASPGGKTGKSLSIYWPDGGTKGWDHLVHDLGNTAIPTSGKVTVEWSFMQTGDPQQQWVQGICRDYTSYYCACVRGERGDAILQNKMGLYVQDLPAVWTSKGVDYSSDVWNTVGLVFDMDATENNLEVYVSKGLDPLNLDDYWTTQTIDLEVWPIVTFQALRYGYPEVGTWTNYIDDLAIYSGMPITGHATPGDADRDGFVNEADAAIVAENWLSGDDVHWRDGDFNADGVVDDIDATLMATNWTGSSANAAVPEPGTLSLLIGLMTVSTFVSAAAQVEEASQ